MKKTKLLKKVLLTVAIMGICFCAGMGAREVAAAETPGHGHALFFICDKDCRSLSDAEFILYKKGVLMYAFGNFEYGTYFFVNYTSDLTPTSELTSFKGCLNLADLSANDPSDPDDFYVLKEMKAPNGYVTTGREIKFTISENKVFDTDIIYDYTVTTPIDYKDFIAGIFTGVNAGVYWQNEITLEAPATNTFTAELYRNEQLLETVQNNACFFTFGENEYNSQLFETLEEKFMAWANGETVEPYTLTFTVKQAIPANTKNIVYDTTIYTVTRDIYFGSDGNIMYGGKIEADGAETELEQITFINTKTGVDAETETPETPETPEAEEPEKTEPIVTPGDLTNVYISKLRIRRIVVFDKDGNIGVYPKY